MKERTSKTLLLIESLVFLAPVTCLTLLYAVVLIPMLFGMSGEPWGAYAAPVFTYLGLALQLCGWSVIAAFLTEGRDGIRKVHKARIHAIILGAALVTFSCIVVILMILDIELPDVFALLSINYIALPALIPFTHVMLERWCSREMRIGELPAAPGES